MPCDQQDINVAIPALETSCAAIAKNLREKGVNFHQPPTRMEGQDLDYLFKLESYNTDLLVLASRAGLKLETPTGPKGKPSVSGARGEATTEAAPDLSAAELAALNWKEKTEYAGQYLSAEKARAIIQGRALKGLSATEQILRANGCKNLSELRARKAKQPVGQD